MIKLRDWDLDLSFIRGKAYDGVGAMAGSTKGVAVRIQSQYPKVIYNCAACHLNLCIVKCHSIWEISNMMDVANSVVKFFKYSPKTSAVFWGVHWCWI